MPTNLLLAPVGAGKTQIALDRLADTIRQSGLFAKIWVLLPTQRQQDTFRQRLTERERHVYFNIHFFDFYSLHAHLLDAARQPQRRLEPTARLTLLRHLLTDLQKTEQLHAFERIAHTPGFLRNVAEFIYELKQNLIFPETFTKAAQSLKDRDLALIYSAYQERLRKHDLVDREGEGWLALSLVQGSPQIGADVTLLLVDGYDQFTPVQAELLTVLASRARDTLITLTTVPGRDQNIGRRFFQAYQRLRTAHERVQQSAHVEIADVASAAQTRHPALRHLVENGFLPAVDEQPAAGAVQFIEAPGVEQEVAAVFRRVKRLILTTSRPDDILIAIRDWERYSPHLAVYSRAYGIPVASRYGEKLAANPAIIAILELLALHVGDFRRRDLLDTLRSPYFEIPGLTSTHVDQLERVSRAFLVTGGRSAWLDAIALAARVPLDDDDDQSLLLTVQQAEYLRGHLAAFFDSVTPAEQASVGDYVRWLEQLIGHDRNMQEPDEGGETPDSLYVLDRMRATNSDHLLDRDLHALACLKRVLRSLIAARELLKALDNAAQLVKREAFLDELRTAVASTEIESNPNRTGRVLVTTVTDARGLPHKHVFILSLSEGLFPRPVSEDPLYLDSERQHLAQRGITLATQAERADDDGLFYELISLARDSLTLSRPSVQDGVPWPASHLWRETLRVFNDIEVTSYRIGAVVPSIEVASFNEVALSVADGLNQPTPTPVVAGLYNWLINIHSAHWSAIARARQIEMSRMSRRPYDRYSGRLSDSKLIAQVASLIGPEHVWSASQFNDYGVCGFRFFAKRLLKLEEWEEADEGIDSAQYGTLNHDILETVYLWLKGESVTIVPENAERAVEMLRIVAQEKFREAPQRLGFRATALWEHETRAMLRKLEALMIQDFSSDSPLSKMFGEDPPRQPYRLEAPFGTAGRKALEVDIGGEKLKVQGYIDRMDRQGSRVMVVDYKTGSSRIDVSEMEGGRNFQMMLYLLAAQQIIADDITVDAPDEVAGGMFWHIGTREASGKIALDDEGQESIAMAREHLANYIKLGRRGDFAARVNKLKDGKCSHYCEFREMCRVSVVNRYKP